MIRFVIFMSFVFACPVFSQSIQTESSVKQQQGDEPNQQQQGKSNNASGQRKKTQDSDSFPITVHGPQQQLKIGPADPPAALVSHWRGFFVKRDRNTIGSLVQMYSRGGQVLCTIPCDGIVTRSNQAVADTKRQRIYLIESVAESEYRIGAFDFIGNRLWTVTLPRSRGRESLMVDPQTGNLWVSRRIAETIVFDPEGKMVVSIPSWHIVVTHHDQKTDSFVMINEVCDVLRVSRDFEILSKSKAFSTGICFRSSLLLDSDGTVWTYGRPLQSKEFLRQFSSEGKLLYEVRLNANDGKLRIERWREGELLLLDIGRKRNHRIFDKKTKEFKPYTQKGPLFTRGRSSIWFYGEKGVSATDFNSKEIFSQKAFTLEDWEKERAVRQEQADSLVKEFVETEPVVRRARKAVADWSKLMDRYGAAHKKSRKIVHSVRLHLVESPQSAEPKSIKKD